MVLLAFPLFRQSFNLYTLPRSFVVHPAREAAVPIIVRQFCRYLLLHVLNLKSLRDSSSANTSSREHVARINCCESTQRCYRSANKSYHRHSYRCTRSCSLFDEFVMLLLGQSAKGKARKKSRRLKNKPEFYIIKWRSGDGPDFDGGYISPSYGRIAAVVNFCFARGKNGDAEGLT